MNIVTSLCIDNKDHSFNYQLYYLNKEQKRLTYWKCCVTFFATSFRCNPEFKRLLYTNDHRELIWKGVNIKSLLEDLGVEIVYLPFDAFEEFRHLSKYHFPTLYKFLVIREISKLKDDSTFFIDSDCVWTRPFQQSLFNFTLPVLYDVYQKTDHQDKSCNNLSPEEMGRLFKKLDHTYPLHDPKLFGGELLGGESRIFSQICAELDRTLKISPVKTLAGAVFPNGKSIFDGDEFLMSMVLNRLFNNYQLANGFLKRIWTGNKVNNVHMNDLNLTIWHVISEKTTGIPLLFDQIADKNSRFWSISLSDFNRYLGNFLNIPKKKTYPEIKLPILYRKILFRLRTGFFRLKFTDFV